MYGTIFMYSLILFVVAKGLLGLGNERRQKRDIMDSIKFSELELSKEMQHAVEDMGFDGATKIQSESIPLILQGNDVIGHSQTGSGKTAAFGIPAIEMVDTKVSSKCTQVLILCPTRELALQATEELRKFSKYKEGIKIAPVYGGEQITVQFRLLRQGCQIVVGTPGRIMDHIRRKTLKLSELKMVILDEADEMLNMGFREDIETILKETPEARQTILFSATMPKPILDITKQFQTDPKIVKIEQKQLTVSTIEQSFFEIARGRKTDAMCLLLEYYQPKISVVFCNTKKMVDELVADLEKRGYSAQGLHGDMKQTQRTQVMNRFKDGNFGILVATDVAARGIDVNDIDIVFNYDLPNDDEYYVHRIGRTGRAGKEGKSFSLIQGGKQFQRILEISHYTKCRIERRSLPLVSQIKDNNAKVLTNTVKAYMANNDCTKHKQFIDELVADGTALEDIACALFGMCIKETSVTEDVGIAPSKHNDGAMGKKGKRDGGRYDRSDRKSGRDRDRQPRSKGKSTKKYNDEDMAQVKISIGRKDHVAPNHILGAVAGESGLPGKLMGAIDISREYTTIDVPKQYKTQIVKSLNRSTIMGKKVTAK